MELPGVHGVLQAFIRMGFWANVDHSLSIEGEMSGHFTHSELHAA